MSFFADIVGNFWERLPVPGLPFSVSFFGFWFLVFLVSSVFYFVGLLFGSSKLFGGSVGGVGAFLRFVPTGVLFVFGVVFCLRFV